MTNFSYGSKLDVSTEKLDINEKEITITGFKRAYGVAVKSNIILIPDFITGFIYELDLKSKKTKILTRKLNKLEYLSFFKSYTTLFN